MENPPTKMDLKALQQLYRFEILRPIPQDGIEPGELDLRFADMHTATSFAACTEVVDRMRLTFPVEMRNKSFAEPVYVTISQYTKTFKEVGA